MKGIALGTKGGCSMSFFNLESYKNFKGSEKKRCGNQRRKKERETERGREKRKDIK